MFIFPLIATLIATPTVLEPPPVAQVAPILIGADSSKKFAFDWDGKHADGTAGAIVTALEFRYMSTAPATPQKLVRIDTAIAAGETIVPVKVALAGVPDGVYDAQVRLVGPSGNASEFSPVLAVTIQVKKASRPTKLRVVGLGSGSSFGFFGGGSRSGMNSLSSRLSCAVFSLGDGAGIN